MSEFQSVVNRQYTPGFIGEIVRDGTLRAKPGRLKSATAINRISRVATYAAQTGAPDSALANGTVNLDVTGKAAVQSQVGFGGVVAEVEIGGDGAFFGVLAHPKHYALVGDQTGTLAPSLNVLQNSEGEFVDATAGILVEVFNATTSVQNIAYGDKLAYMLASASASDNAQSVPAGGIVAYSGTTLPKGCAAIPGAFVSTPNSITASAAGKPVAGVVMIQMAN